MKKLLTAVLLCAMLITTLVPVAMAEQADANAGQSDGTYYDATHESNFKKELPTNADKWTEDPTADEISEWYATLSNNAITIDSAKKLVAFATKLNEGESFESVTVTLTTSIDLGGKEWIRIAADKSFKGIFDGNHNAIGNYTMNLTSNTAGFFSVLEGSAEVKNLSLVSGTLKNGNTKTSGSLNYVGTLAGKVAPSATIKISNVYSNVGTLSSTETVGEGGDVMAYVGGFFGLVKGEGNVTIENSKYAGTIDNGLDATSAANGVAGFIAQIEQVAGVTVNNCAVNTTIKNADGKRVGGVIGRAKGMTGDLSVTKCNIDTTFTNTTGEVAGVLAFLEGACKNIEISNCNINANWNCGANSGGLIGTIKNQGIDLECLTIDNCAVTGVLNVGNFSGGFIGSMNSATKLSMSDCVFNGTLTARRVSGGIVGKMMIKGTDNVINNCSIGENAILNIRTDEGSVGEIGGFIGRLASDGTLTLSNAKMLGTLNSTFNSSAESGNEYAAALIGKVDSTNTVVKVVNPTITGHLNFANKNTTAVTESIALICAGVKANTVNLEYEDVIYNPTSVSKAAGLTLTMCGFAANPGDNAVVGYQTRANGEDKYDLRYVVALNMTYGTEYDRVGITVEIDYGEGETKEYQAYVEKLYKSVNGDGMTYTAESLGGEFLYTVVIEGIPNDINVEDGTMKVTLNPFTELGTGESAATTLGATATHGSVADTAE